MSDRWGSGATSKGAASAVHTGIVAPPKISGSSGRECPYMSRSARPTWFHSFSWVAAVSRGLAGAAAQAQQWPVTPGQRATAQQVAQAGVPLSELAPDAPDSYTIKRGDTLWDISKIFLRSPWRWPELWGM